MKSTTKGVLTILFPFALLILTLTLHAVSRFIFMSVSTSGGAMSTLAILNVVLSLLGILSILLLFICIPLGIYFLAKNEKGSVTNEPLKTEIK